MEVFKEVFSRPKLVVYAILSAMVVFTFSVWLPNWKLVAALMPSELATATEKASLLLSLYGSIQTNFTVVSASYTIAIAVLFGMNVALFIHYIRTRQGRISSSSSAIGLGGLVSGFFGVGCAACGTFILTAALGLIGGVGLISILPLGGEEFGILGVLLLGYSMYAITKKIQEPLVCNTVEL